jgi:hypothetical protein
MQPGPPWDDKLVLRALRQGGQALAEWALANEPGAAGALKADGCGAAIKCDNDKSRFDLVRAHGGEWSDACSSALSTGKSRFDLVQHCINNGCEMNEAIFNHAVSAMDVVPTTLLPHLRFLKSKGCPWSAATMTAAASTSRSEWVWDDFSVIYWLGKAGCPYNASVCAVAAATAGWSLHRLRELYEMGFKLDGSVCVAAAQAGRLDTLQWAHRKGYPLGGCADLVVTAAPVREWLLAQGVACRSG